MRLTQKILPHYTYTDYLLQEGKWELIDGFPIAMNPSPLPGHQRISAALGSSFTCSLEELQEMHRLRSD